MKKIRLDVFKQLWIEQETDNSDDKPQLIEEIKDAKTFKDLFASLALWSTKPIEERVNSFVLRNGYELREEDEESLMDII